MTTARTITLKSKPKATIQTVTPKDATRWLEGNVKNRNIRQRLVDSYARDMTNGAWQLTGEAIKFTPDWELLDGQHRLLAVIQSGTAVDMLIVSGVNETAQEVMDSGAKRQASDALHLRGHANAALLASIARLGLIVDTDGYDALHAKSAQFTTTEITNYVTDHPEMEGFTHPAWTTSKHMDCSPSVIGYAMWRLFTLDPDEAAEFFEKASTKVGLDKDDPILTMTRRLSAAVRNRERLSQGEQLSVIFRAWNARRQGKKLTTIPVTSREGVVPVPEPK